MTIDDTTGYQTDALQAGLHARADLVTISRPPIAEVRQRAQKRRKRRRLVQGLSGVTATCAVVAGVIALSPSRGADSSPAPTTSFTPAPTHTTAPTTSAPTTSIANYLQASDLGPGWHAPVGAGTRPAPILGSSQCGLSGAFNPPMPIKPAPNYSYTAPGNSMLEAVYTYAPGNAPKVMADARTALTTGCGRPQEIKLLDSPTTVADEAIVFTVGGDSRNVLVRSGDRVASAVVSLIPAGQAGATWIDTVAQRMATRLTGG